MLAQTTSRIDRIASHYDQFQSTILRTSVGAGLLNYGLAELGDEHAQQAAQRLCHEVFRLADIHADDVVLDVGTGTGAQDILLAKTYAFRSLLGVNVSKRQVDHANSRAAELGLEGKLRFVQSRAESVPFVSDHSVDKVLAIECATYFERARFYAEAQRVLKPGGRLVLADYAFHPRLSMMAVDKRWHHGLGMLETCGTTSGNRLLWERHFATLSVRDISTRARPGAQRAASEVLRQLLRMQSSSEVKTGLRMVAGTQLVAWALATGLMRYELITLEPRK